MPNNTFFDYGGSRIFEYSVAIADIWAKFDTEAKNDLPERDLLPYFTSDKIQDGGRRHFEIHINGYNSVAIAHLHIILQTDSQQRPWNKFALKIYFPWNPRWRLPPFWSWFNGYNSVAVL